MDDLELAASHGRLVRRCEHWQKEAEKQYIGKVMWIAISAFLFAAAIVGWAKP